MDREKLLREIEKEYPNADIESISNIVNSADDDQVKAITCSLDKNVMISAGAGSGKTKTLVSRIVYLLSIGIPADEIMLLTFTNKAAEEMKTRTIKILGTDKHNILAGTFHHVAGRFLRKYAKMLGYSSNYTILTPEDAKDLLKLVRHDYLSSEDVEEFQDFPKAKDIYNMYSSAINKDRTLTSIIKENGYSDLIVQAILDIVNEYISRKYKSNLMDFDDLIVLFHSLLSEFPTVREQIGSQFKYILLDECQDTNSIQAELLSMLNEYNQQLYIVGDISQSIYKFRGADISMMLNFEKNFTNVEKINIRYNYRSKGNILKLAENSINNNTYSEKVEIIPYRDMGELPKVKAYKNEYYQGDDIANEIIKIKKSREIPYKEMAILIRTNYAGNILEQSLRKNKIPYKLLSGINFSDRKHIRDMVSFLKFISNPLDQVSLLRILGLYKGIGDKGKKDILNYISTMNGDLTELYLGIAFNLPIKLRGNAEKSFVEFIKLLVQLKDIKNIDKKIEVIYEKIYKEYMIKNLENIDERIEDIEFLKELGKSYDSIDSFLETTILNSDIGNSDNIDNDKVVITTIHKSKGLEWDVVFIPNLNQGIFPSNKCETDDDIEEERRLYYVSVTRSKELLYMSYSETGEPSLFLKELEPNLYIHVNRTNGLNSSVYAGTRFSNDKYDMGEYKGTRFSHSRFLR